MSPFYSYDAVVGWYHLKPQTGISAAVDGLTGGSADPAATLNAILGVNDPSNTNTGPNSTNNAALNTTNALLANLLNNISITNYGAQTAISGNAAVTDNTTGGSAKSGAAKVVSNLLNLLNAMWTWGSGGFSYFVHNIFGNQTGDINLTTPSITGGGGQVGALPACSGAPVSNTNTGSNSTNNASSNCTSDINVNNQTTGSITNNYDLLAKSGNATVSGNTTGGDAASGDARAELNIINLINSAIGAGQTFFGIINIYGNLNGDILFPSLGLNGAVGSGAGGGGASVTNSGTGPGSTNTATQNNQNTANLTNTNTAAFNNNIQTAAASGNATVADNTAAGSATSGNATTSNSLFNLFGTSVFGDNAVLVIVNDLGHWMGKIFNLGGNTSLGGLLTSNAVVQNVNTGPGSTNTASGSDTNNLNLTNSSTGMINNNIKVGAQSGDASVTDNTSAGSATSGNAQVATNVANLYGDSLSFTHWFGVLIINVFGSWFGSVGVDTAAGNTPAPVSTSAAPGKGGAPAATYAFITSAGNGHPASIVTGSIGGGPAVSAASQAIGSNKLVKEVVNQPSVQALASAHHSSGLLFLAAALLLVAALMMSIDRRVSRRSR